MFHRRKLGGHSFRVSCFVSQWSLYKAHINDSTCIPRKWELETWDFRFGERCLSQCSSKPFVEASYGNDACLESEAYATRKKRNLCSANRSRTYSTAVYVYAKVLFFYSGPTRCCYALECMFIVTRINASLY